MIVGLVLAALTLQGGDLEATAEQPLALVLSGGVSLGAYEAGLAWATVAFSRNAGALTRDDGVGRTPRLVAITGASAGGANAMLAAMMWCETADSPRNTSVDDNILHDLWLPVGLDALLPWRDDSYEANDGLLAIRPLTTAMEHVHDEVFGPDSRMRFAPGCRLPLGVTMTRLRPEELSIAGLTTLTQKYVMPWAVEVRDNGALTFVRQPLPGSRAIADNVLTPPVAEGASNLELTWPQVTQALLASAAFPMAFGARDLCDCTTRCDQADHVRDGVCAAPAGPMKAMRCPKSTHRGRDVVLCKSTYVDGGIFDNAPVGLNIDLVEATYDAPASSPVRYIFVDPDVRRLAPERTQATRVRPTKGIASTLDLFTGLVATSRNADLSRAVREGGWNRTTANVLRNAANSMVSLAFVYGSLRAQRDGVEVPYELPRALPDASSRAGLGRALLGCLQAQRSISQLQSCAHRIINEAALADSAAPPLTDREVLAIAEAFASVNRDDAPVPSDEGVTELLILAQATFAFLSDEVDTFQARGLDEARVQQLKTSFLSAVRGLPAFVTRSSDRLREAMVPTLSALDVGAAMHVPVARAQEALQKLPAGELYSDADIAPVEAALATLAERDSPPAIAVERLRRLSRLRLLVKKVSGDLADLASDATDLMAPHAGERSLALSSRFAPLGGSQLYNFGGFLDQPLRQFDYYAGVYDSLHTIAEAVCSSPGLAPYPPMRLLADGGGLDVSALETQRCIGLALGQAFAILGIGASDNARFVFVRLATLELAASLDDAAAAHTVLGDLQWGWLAAMDTTKADPNLRIVVDTLLSRRVRCRASSAETNCLEELPFETMLSALRDGGYKPTETHMRQALRNVDSWTASATQLVLDRSLAIERRFADREAPLTPVILRAHGIGEWVVRPKTVEPVYPRFDLDPSTIPNNSGARSAAFAHVLPYRASVDVANGGLGLAWLEPALELAPWLALKSTVEVVDFQGKKRGVATTVGGRMSLRAPFGSVGVGPRFSLPWDGTRRRIGIEGRVGVFNERFEVGMGVRELDPRPGSSSAFFISLSVADLNGLAYWLVF